jgi:photosystem II stability/assembly factor-like uncharacterized protein
MRYILVTILLVSIFGLSGCLNANSGSTIGGVFKSIDNGRTYESKNFVDEKKSLAKSNVFAIAIDPIESNIIYAGTEKDDVYMSQDGAETWNMLDSKLSNISSIVVNPYNTNILYISGLYQNRGSVIRSIDKGKSWERVYVEPQDGTNITTMILSPKDGNVVYIGTSGGTIAKTVNGGKVWKNLYNAEKKVTDLRIDTSDVNTLYALIETVDILRSRDNGVTFESIKDLERDKETENAYQGNIYSMTVSPSVAGILVIGTDKGVFRSENYGQSWVVVDVIASTIGIPIHAIEINPHNVNQLVYAAAKAVYTSIADGWAITDTTSNRTVDTIVHDPINSNNIYLGLKKVK